MRKNAVILPAAALILGAAGMFLRSSELKTVFDEITGLARRGAQVSTLLIALSCVAVAASLVFAIITGLRYRSPRGFENAFGPLGVQYVLALSGVGVVWLGSAVYSLITAATAQPAAVSGVYLSALSALSALSVILLSIWLYKEPTRNARLFFCVIPPLFLCMQLVFLYRANSANPVLLEFCYESLAVITSAMAFYFTAGYVYGRAAPGKTAFSCLTAVFFCLVTMADSIPVSRKLVFGAMLVIHLVNVSMMIGRLVPRVKADGADTAE